MDRRTHLAERVRLADRHRPYLTGGLIAALLLGQVGGYFSWVAVGLRAARRRLRSR
jgi:hypothetical protein